LEAEGALGAKVKVERAPVLVDITKVWEEGRKWRSKMPPRG